ncbi:MAG: gliding motility-associated protein GldE, partial [Bacteroidales bacterium]|nr:gliding motility-associated protein GldE [Bacteroidales bacterium]
EKLLATIHISNNFINVGIVIVSTFIATSLFDFQQDPLYAFMIQLAVVAFLLLVFGEIVPKLLASQNALRISLLMASPLTFLDRLFIPVSRLLIFSSRILQRKISTGNQNLSMVDLSDALDLTTGFVQEDKKILRSIVNFSNIEVNEIMKPRLDIVAVEKNTKLEELVRVINDSGYSRIPVYSETFDNISGILYVKDLLPHIDRDNDFQWHSLIRSAYYVPGSKKINVLLQEFREKKIHLAIVVDEYGGTEGIVTLEDIMEEIVGEITDESDEVESYYTRIDEKNYVFDAKTLLNDFYKTLQLQEDIFETIRGDADTLAGLVLELLGDLPNQNDIIKIDPFTFTILSVDNREIKKIKVSFDRPIR